MFRRRGTIIAEGLRIKGSVLAEGLVEVNGNIEGDVHCTALFVSPKAAINGGVEADRVVVNGRLIHAGRAVPIFELAAAARPKHGNDRLAGLHRYSSIHEASVILLWTILVRWGRGDRGGGRESETDLMLVAQQLARCSVVKLRNASTHTE
jgi:hypothetical protein